MEINTLRSQILRLLLLSIVYQTQPAMGNSTNQSKTIGLYSENRHNEITNCMIAIAKSLDPSSGSP
jgi:hypothetical protein